jgi:hypothetical protein
LLIIPPKLQLRAKKNNRALIDLVIHCEILTNATKPLSDGESRASDPNAIALALRYPFAGAVAGAVA